MRSSLPGLLLLLCLPGRAQLIDSIGGFLSEPPRILFALDTRGSFIANRNVRLLGVKAGLEHAGRVRYGIGYSLLASPVEGTATVVEGGTARTVRTRLRLGYVAPFFSYTFFKRGHWEAAIPVQVGLGAGSLVYDRADGRPQTLTKGFVLLYEPAMTVQYRFLRHLAIGGGWGFRLAWTHADLDNSLTAPIYLFGLKVYFGDLWRELRGAE
jgi:hypothetical protein